MNIIDKLQKQWNHWFYKESDAYREGIKQKQLEKAAEKYPKPFNPEDFTPEELVEHAMMENYDQQNYIYGLYVKIQQLEKNEHAIQENCELRKKIENTEKEIEYYKDQLTDQISNTHYWFVKAQEYQQKMLDLKKKK